MKKLLGAAIIAATVVVGPASAQAPAVVEQAKGADYVDLLNTLYAVGCATGALVGIGAAAAILRAFPGYFVSFTLAGCGAGMMAGPLGMLVHDHTTGDNTIARYISDRYPELIEDR